jgi:predicted RNA-binding Zn-ribbon protein involved in translation (DUF1610 family)
MIQLKLERRRLCASCGTDLVVDNIKYCPKELPCPWCGASIVIYSVTADQKLEDVVSLIPVPADV